MRESLPVIGNPFLAKTFCQKNNPKLALAMSPSELEEIMALLLLLETSQPFCSGFWSLLL
jgi:hypothetical protein